MEYDINNTNRKGCILMSTIYTEADFAAIAQQHKKRWIYLTVPCVVLLAVIIYSLIVRIEWLTTLSTIIIGFILIAGHDFAIKPVHRYLRHLDHSLHGRTASCELPFIRMSENIDVVDGVSYRQVLCADIDGKNRPYERLFYFDANKQFPNVKEGDMLHIDSYELTIANVYPL